MMTEREFLRKEMKQDTMISLLDYQESPHSINIIMEYGKKSSGK